jgi:uncharacterized protein (DUF433 family)
MAENIQIVDRGRGPQLSTCRITVQDLVPYFQQHLSHAEIMEIMPILTSDEISAVEKYVHENLEAVMAQDRVIRERAASRRTPPEVEARERKERLARLDQARRKIIVSSTQ